MYHYFKQFGSGLIPPLNEFRSEALEARDLGVLDDVYNYYGQFSAWKLRNMTHEEAPWKNAVDRAQKVITNLEMRNYFLNEVSEEYIKSYEEA